MIKPLFSTNENRGSLTDCNGRIPVGILPLVFLGSFSFGLQFFVVPLLHLVCPGHQGFQPLMGWGFIEVRQHRQRIEQVIVRIDSVSFVPLMEVYFAWVHEQDPETILSEKTRDGLKYSLNQEKYLRVFLEEGKIPIFGNGACHPSVHHW